MNIFSFNIFFVRFMVYEIPRVSVFRHCPYSVTFPYLLGYLYLVLNYRTKKFHDMRLRQIL